MRSLRLRRPSPAMVVAVVALVVALGGSAWAVSRINGTSIKPRSIPGDRVRRDALTGTEINEAKLGRVNSARNATNATNSKFALRASAADSAANALNAGSALSAGNAAALGGNPPGAFQGRIRWALVGSGGGVVDQSGGFGGATRVGAGSYVVDFGSSLAHTALVVTPNGIAAAGAAAAPCGGGLPGAVSCASGNDGNHAGVHLPADGSFYIAAIG